MKNWKDACVDPAMPIEDVLRTIDAVGLQIAFVLDGQSRLCGTVTDGDVRRGILRGVSLREPVSTIMNSRPLTAGLNEDREIMLARMRSREIRHLPIVDEAGLMVGMERVPDLLELRRVDNPVVLMAGGVGSRLAPLTNDRPKPLIPVGGRPIIETILLNFIVYGFHRFYVSVNYKAEMIMDFLGDGSAWNVHIEYIRETSPLGTAGALALIPERPALPFLVMNGDILTKLHFGNLLDFHQQRQAVATMCIREHEYQVPYGVVHLDGQSLNQIDEKPVQKYFVNAGIYVLDPSAIDYIPANQYFDITSLFDELIAAKAQVAAFPLREYWLDIGRHSDLALAQKDFSRFF
jgi:dTDP-glucose pyrophosphorylase